MAKTPIRKLDLPYISWARDKSKERGVPDRRRRGRTILREEGRTTQPHPISGLHPDKLQPFYNSRRLEIYKNNYIR